VTEPKLNIPMKSEKVKKPSSKKTRTFSIGEELNDAIDSLPNVDWQAFVKQTLTEAVKQIRTHIKPD